MTDQQATHDPRCAVVRSGDLRAWCDCGLGGNRVPASYLKRFLPSQGRTENDDMPHDLRLFMETIK
jgi:hypothetical protein